MRGILIGLLCTTMTGSLSCYCTESHLGDQVLNYALYCSPLKATELVACARHCDATEARRGEGIVLVLKELPAYGQDNGDAPYCMWSQEYGHRTFTK